MKTLLITGGCGFIGSNFIRHMLSRHEDWHIVNLDKLTYAGNPVNLEDFSANDRYNFVKGDICHSNTVHDVFENHTIWGVVHFAAESHVDRSILNAAEFIDTNVKGTMVLLDVARRFGIERFIHISTDEVYGDLGDTGVFVEDSPLRPNSPYAASKAAADLLVQSYIHTHNFPAIIVRPSNNYGRYQYPEKLIPLMIINALQDKSLPVYGDGMNVRDWLYVEDTCSAIETIIDKGRIGEAYNVGGGTELPNLELVTKLLRILGKPESLIEFVEDRPGHDRRYALDCSKIENEMQWHPRSSFDTNLEITIRWYSDHPEWWNVIMKKEYQQYYETQYTKRKREVR
jgi:dTDP-glucose 4,6-dehydratase